MTDKLTDYIIRPTRRRYDPAADLGPTLFTIDYIYYGSRTDFEVKNRRNKILKCSLFHHNIHHNERYPLMVYCHGNSGNRSYSYEIVYKMLKQRISVLTFDFAGCGNSEGKYVFLGLFEQFDIEDVLNYALAKYNFIDHKKIGVWGRSMGAVATLLFAARNHYISLIVLDSPFKDLSELLKEYINRVKIVSSLFGKSIYSKIRKRALEKANFDFEELKPIECISTCRAPAFFVHASKDKIVPMHHSKALFEVYPADKEYLEMKGGHNSKRPPEVYEAINKFIQDIFGRVGKGSQVDRGIIKQKKDKDYYYNEEKETKEEEISCLNEPVLEHYLSEVKQQKDYPPDDEFETSMAIKIDAKDYLSEGKQQKDYCQDDFETSIGERVDMKELNQQFLSAKEPEERGVSMLSINDDSTFR